MNSSPTIAKLAAALVRAQRNIGGAVKGTANPFFKSRFADLGEIIAVCKAALLDEDIAVSQMPCTLSSGAPGLETILLHSSGEWMSNAMPVICAKEKDPQALGSAVTYARRYALQSALLIPAVDDDGEAAMYRQEQREVRDEQNRASGPQKPVQAPEPESKGDGPQTWKCYVESVKVKDGTSKKGKAYTLYTMEFLLGGDITQSASTFDATMADRARQYAEIGQLVSASVILKERGGFELLGMVEIAETGLN